MSKPTREYLLKILPVYETKEGEIISKDKVADYEKTYNSSAYPVYDDEQVEQILNAETEAQQSCTACHNTLENNGYDISKYQNYCQWCGRKLH